VAVTVELDAIVLADNPLARVVIAGLPAVERANRVAKKIGAARVLIVDGAETTRGAIAAWRGDRTSPLLVIRANQLVHTPLVSPLVESLPANGVAIAISPDDGSFGGAYVATGEAGQAAALALARGEDDAAFAGDAVERVPYGDIARHPIATPEERKGAHRLLYGLMIKRQDNAISRYVFRPLARRMTMLFVHTPITPNMLTVLVAAMVAVACWLTATPDPRLVLLGAVIQVSSCYFDCCDGEIARLKLMSSKFGAWLDTIVDELSTVGYMVACGWHCHLYWGHPGWDMWTVGIVVGVTTYAISIYCIYYNIIVGVGSANSQDYASKFEIVTDASGAQRIKPVAEVVLAPKRPLPPVIAKILEFAPNIVRRDFIVWCALVFAIFHVIHVSFIVLLAGGVVSAVITTKDHFHLRGLVRRVARSAV